MITSLILFSIALGSPKPWYQGPEERKSTVNGWMNYAMECMEAPRFDRKSITFKYQPVRGTKRYASGWAYIGEAGRYVHGETFLVSRDDFIVKVAVSPDGKWDDEAHGTEGHEIGHVIAYNQFREIGHPAKYRKCFKGWSDSGNFDVILEGHNHDHFDHD